MKAVKTELVAGVVVKPPPLKQRQPLGTDRVLEVAIRVADRGSVDRNPMRQVPYHVPNRT
jgi:hypothetical protein